MAVEAEHESRYVLSTVPGWLTHPLSVCLVLCGVF